jgi:hypothetical protein
MAPGLRRLRLDRYQCDDGELQRVRLAVGR